jgi:DNA-binding transcriptional ArsR family regulator
VRNSGRLFPVTSEPSRGHVHDPRVLRAIAHPVRNRILTELTATGPMRAADLARELGVPANQASFHLRQLAKYGLIEEAPEAARDQRDRVWKAAVDEGLSIDVAELQKEPGGKAAAKVFMRNAASFAHEVVDAAYHDDRPPGTHRSTMESAVRLTKDEAGQLSKELAEVLHAWSERTRGRDDGRRTYLFHGMLLPHPELALPADEEKA